MLGGHPCFRLDEAERQLLLRVKLKEELPVLEHNGPVFHALSPLPLGDLVHEEAVLDHVLEALFLRPVGRLQLVLAGDLAVEDVLHELVVPLGARAHDRAGDLGQERLVNLSRLDVHPEEDRVRQPVHLRVQGAKPLTKQSR